MNLHDESPLDDMTDEPIPTSIPLAAVEAMVKSLELDYADFEKLLEEKKRFYFDGGMDYPDWLIAGLNCKDDEMILPIVIHTYLSDWRPE